MKVDEIEQEYWWEIKAYLEKPTEDNLLRLLEEVYTDAYNEGHFQGSYQ
jgi:hypothetical protein